MGFTLTSLFQTLDVLSSQHFEGKDSIVIQVDEDTNFFNERILNLACTRLFAEQDQAHQDESTGYNHLYKSSSSHDFIPHHVMQIMEENNESVFSTPADGKLAIQKRSYNNIYESVSALFIKQLKESIIDNLRFLTEEWQKIPNAGYCFIESTDEKCQVCHWEPKQSHVVFSKQLDIRIAELAADIMLLLAYDFKMIDSSPYQVCHKINIGVIALDHANARLELCGTTENISLLFNSIRKLVNDLGEKGYYG